MFKTEYKHTGPYENYKIIKSKKILSTVINNKKYIDVNNNKRD